MIWDYLRWVWGSTDGHHMANDGQWSRRFWPLTSLLEWPGRSGIKIHPDDPFLDPGFIGICPQRDTTWYPWWLDVLVNHSSEHVPPVYSSWAGRCSMPRPSIPWWNCKTRWRNCGRLSAWGTKVIDGIWGDLLVNNKHRFSKLQQQHAVPLLITVQQLQETHPAGSTTTIRGWFGDFLSGPII